MAAVDAVWALPVTREHVSKRRGRDADAKWKKRIAAAKKAAARGKRRTAKSGSPFLIRGSPSCRYIGNELPNHLGPAKTDTKMTGKKNDEAFHLSDLLPRSPYPAIGRKWENPFGYASIKERPILFLIPSRFP